MSISSRANAPRATKSDHLGATASSPRLIAAFGTALVALGEGAALDVAQVGRVIVSLIRVTSPFRASARPLNVTALFMVMDVRAMIVPAKLEPDPSVAELVTCQKTLHGCPPLIKATALEEAVTRSDVAWKIHTEFGSFWPSSVSVPVRSRVTPPAL